MPTMWDPDHTQNQGKDLFGEPRDYVGYKKWLDRQRIGANANSISGTELNNIVKTSAEEACAKVFTDINQMTSCRASGKEPAGRQCNCLRCLNSAPANLKVGLKIRDNAIGSKVPLQEFDFMGKFEEYGLGEDKRWLLTTKKENTLLRNYGPCFLSSTAARQNVHRCHYNVNLHPYFKTFD